MAQTGGIQLVDTFRYSGKRFIDLRQHCVTLEELKATPETSIPDGFTKYVEETQSWYEWKSTNDITPETGKWRKSVPISEVLSEEYIYAIVDKDDTLLFGIRFDGEVVYNKGMSDEVRERLKELEGYQLIESNDWLFAITDSMGNVLFGIEHSGYVFIPNGVVEILTWEGYEKITPRKDVLYIIKTNGGSTDGAYINGRAVNTGEAYAFACEANILYYRGKMNVMPKIWADTDSMELWVDYPSDYEGPMLAVEEGHLFVV